MPELEEGQVSPELENEVTVESGAPAVDAGVEGAAAAGTEGADAGVKVEEEYTPSYEFKVHGETKEFDDWAKELVKDKESEEFYRDIMTKIHGLDHIKNDRESLREQITSLQEVQQKHDALNQSLDVLTEYARSGNYDAFFSALKLPEEKVIQWAANRLRYQEMSPAERAEYDQRVNSGREAVMYQQQSQTLSQQVAQLQHQQKMFELDQHLSRPELSTAAQEYDQRVGEPGAFRKLVQDRGVFHWHANQVDIPVEQAVNEALKIVGIQTAQAQPQQQMQMGQANPAAHTAPAQPKAPAKKPVIPNIEGSGRSAIKQLPKSIDDLRKIAAARAGAQ